MYICIDRQDMEAHIDRLNQRIRELEEDGEELRERARAEREDRDSEQVRALELERARQNMQACVHMCVHMCFHK